MALAVSPLNERKRVKVYELRENDWFDRGTGFCAANMIHDEARIFVEAEEESDRTLLEVNIKKDDMYQKQQDTLIVWTDQEGVDMALSFQEAEGCGAVWTLISDVQQRLTDGFGDGSHQLTLPHPGLPQLTEIEDVVGRASMTQAGRDALSKLVVKCDYIASLIPLVEIAEDFESLVDLHRLCRIMKTLFLLNDTAIIEYVVKDEIILGVVGALEYDPDFPNHKANHRQYLSDAARFKEVVRIDEPDIKRRIHYTYRLQYLKDVVLARILDDPTFSVLNSLIFYHQVEIVSYIQQNNELLEELFAIVSSPDSEPQKKKDAVLFIQQSCAIAKGLTPAARSALYQNLIHCGLFATITFALRHKDALVRVAGTDILVAVIDHDALMMRNFIFKSLNEHTKPMTETLIDLLLVESDLGVKAQIADAIKVLLDPHPVNGPAAERNLNGENAMRAKNIAMQTESFIDNFYETSAKKLFSPLMPLQKRESMSNLSVHEVSLFSHLVEILCFFLRQHGHRGRKYMLAEGIALRIATLLRSPEKYLKLTALKFFRTLITLQDEFHNRQLVAHNILGSILDVVSETMPRDNLLNSACLELFEFIRRESIKTLIYHLAENYRERLESMTYVDTFQEIILRYEQFINPPPPSTQQTETLDSSFMTSDAGTPQARNITINGGGSRWQGLKDADAEEESYFNSDDGEEEEMSQVVRNEGMENSQVNLASPVSKPLVDYDDDDDDDKLVTSDPVSEEPATSTTALFSTSPPPTGKPSPSSPDAAVNGTSVGITSPRATPPLAATLPSIAEKRRREEEEDEDELGKLSLNIKRRNSVSSTTSSTSKTNATNASENSTLDAGSSPASSELEKPPDKDGDAAKHPPSTPPLRHSLRRTRAFSAKDGKKIAITLGNKKTGDGK